jgi:hypothetical protein
MFLNAHSAQMSPRIFISHKVVDRTLAKALKSVLLQLGMHDEDVFLSEEISPGVPWNEKILDALRSSETLVFIYTDPSLDWDWCLFECGFFAGLPKIGGKDRRLICINAGIGRPSPLDRWQDVSSVGALQNELELLGAETKSDFPKTNEFSTVVTSLWNSLSLGLPQKSDERYRALKQRRMSVTVNVVAMQAIKDGEKIDSGVQIEISDGAREIFANGPLDSQWKDFQISLSSSQKLWAESVGVLIRMLNGVRTASPMLPLVRSNTEGNNVLFRPSVVQRDVFRDGDGKPPDDTKVRYTIIFIRTPDATMPGQSREDRLFHWLTLSRNFRETIIEGYLKKIAATAVNSEDVRQLTQDLLDDMALIRIDSASRGLNLDDDLVLFCAESARALRSMTERWETIEMDLQNYKALAAGLCVAGCTPEQVEGLLSKLKETLNSIRELNQAFTLHVTSALMSSVAYPN